MKRKYRPRARRAVAAVGAILWGVFFFGLIDLIAIFLPVEDDFYEQYMLEAGWGVLYFVLVTLPLLSVAFVPALTSPVTQVALAGGAVAVAAALTLTGPQLLPAAALILIAAVLYLLGSPPLDAPTAGAQQSDRRATRPDTPTLLLTAAAAVPLIWFTVGVSANVRAGLRPNDDISAGLSHWPMQVALALAILATAALTALRQPGWQVSAWTVTIGTAWMGVLSVIYPHHAGSFGVLGGSAAIVWSVLFGAATLRCARRSQTARRRYRTRSAASVQRRRTD
jgi:hypothetical protein